MLVVTTIKGLSAELALSELLSSLQPVSASEITAMKAVADSSNFFIELRNIYNPL
jgi:hypothetical protein